MKKPIMLQSRGTFNHRIDYFSLESIWSSDFKWQWCILRSPQVRTI